MTIEDMLQQWIAEKRYRELISCAHGGWYTDDVIFEPLAEHFVENHLFDELRFLCERGIRFSIEDMLFCIKTEKEEHSALDVKTIQNINADESEAFKIEEFISKLNFIRPGQLAIKKVCTHPHENVYLCFLMGTEALFQIYIFGKYDDIMSDYDEWEVFSPYLLLVHEDFSVMLLVMLWSSSINRLYFHQSLWSYGIKSSRKQHTVCR